MVENRWLDRLKILSWHSSLATQKDMKSVCCRQHLRALIAHWLTQASLRLPPAHTLRCPLAATRLWPISISAPNRLAGWSAN